MNDIENSPVAKKVTKKEARKMVYEKLVAVLGEYKNGLNKKRFESNLKKASKLFAVDIAKACNKALKTKLINKSFDK